MVCQWAESMAVFPASYKTHLSLSQRQDGVCTYTVALWSLAMLVFTWETPRMYVCVKVMILKQREVAIKCKRLQPLSVLSAYVCVCVHVCEAL